MQALWDDPSGTSITLSTFIPRYSTTYGTNRRPTTDLRQVINRITGESSFRVIAPNHATDYQGRGPVEGAVTGLTREGVDRLLRRRVWSLKSITFLPRPRVLDAPQLLLVLEGFLDDSVENSMRAVRRTFERPLVRSRIEQMIRANPEFNRITTNEALRHVPSSVRVTVYALDNGTVVASVFLRSPIQGMYRLGAGRRPQRETVHKDDEKVDGIDDVLG